MRAAVYHGPGDVRIESVPDPGPPGPGELLLAVTRNGICGSDTGEFRHGPRMIPLRERHRHNGHVGPMILGHEFVGRVAEAGPGAAGFAPGQRVACGAGVSCGACEWCRCGRTNLCARYYTIGLQADGGLAELVRAPASVCVAVPGGCTDDAAAMAQPLAVALHALDRSGIGGDRSLAVIGVGGIGSFIVGGADQRGVADILAVDVDAGPLQAATRLGARLAVDGRRADAAGEVRAATGGEGAHVVIEASGTPEGLGQALRMVRRGGRVVVVGLQATPPETDLFDLALREVDLVTTVAHVCATDLPEAVHMLATTPLASLVAHEVIPLDRLVPDGILALAERRARGKILVDPRPGAPASGEARRLVRLPEPARLAPAARRALRRDPGPGRLGRDAGLRVDLALRAPRDRRGLPALAAADAGGARHAHAARAAAPRSSWRPSSTRSASPRTSRSWTSSAAAAWRSAWRRATAWRSSPPSGWTGAGAAR